MASLGMLMLLAAGCAFSVALTSADDNELTIELAAYPARLSVEDSTSTAEVWATVRTGENPVKDNTIVKLATTVGTITSDSQTVDGLAVAILTSRGDNRPRQAEVIAQAVAVRDTIDIDFVVTDQEEF
jgi:hypothetical protein